MIPEKALEMAVQALREEGSETPRIDAMAALEAAAPFMIRKAKADALRNYAAGLEMEAGPGAEMLVKDVADDARAVADEIEREA